MSPAETTHRRLVLPTLIAAAIMMIALAITAAPVLGASTRVDYVAQVNQVCTDFAPQFQKLGRQAKRLDAKLNFVGSESDQQEKRRLNRAFRGIGGNVAKTTRVFGAMVDRLALVSTAPGDEAAVAQWLQGLREFTALQAQTVPAWRHRKIGRLMSLGEQSINALNTGGAAVTDFGISECPTHIDVPETTFQ